MSDFDTFLSRMDMEADGITQLDLASIVRDDEEDINGGTSTNNNVFLNFQDQQIQPPVTELEPVPTHNHRSHQPQEQNEESVDKKVDVKRKSLRRMDVIEAGIDPSFPIELIEQQEDFIFSETYPPSAAPAVVLTKWQKYYERIARLTRTLATKSKTILRKQGEDAELFGYQLFILKRTLREAMAQLSAENAADTRFLSLEQGQGEEDLVDVETIVCSKCGSSDEEGNDILLCDRQHCCRAYHQKCLDPPVLDLDAIKDDPFWFCWVCDTVDNCIRHINAKCGRGFTSVEELFPEVEQESAQWLSKFPEGSYDPEAPKMPYVPLSTRQWRKSAGGEDSEEELAEYSEEEEDTGRRRRKKRSTSSRVSKAFEAGYPVFAKERFSKLREEFPLLPHMALMNLMGKRWQEQDVEEKKRYYTLAQVKEATNPKKARVTAVAPPSASDSIVCKACGKAFKTESGYKYHVANVCIIEIADESAGN